MRGKIRTTLVLACAALILLSVLGPAGAEGGGHDAVNFIRAFDRIREGSSQNTYDADVERGTHGRGPASVEVRPYAGAVGTPATPGSDFQATPRTVSFSDPIEQRTAEIPIIEDTQEEGPETVTLKLENPTDGMVRGFPQELTLTILDNDGPARVSFELAAYEVFENADKVRVYVVRSGDISSPTEINYQTGGGTATAGSDYVTRSGTLEFVANDDFEWIDVTLLNSAADEQSETFNVTLSAPTGAQLISPSVATVTIHDEEGSGSVDFTPPYTAFHQPLQGKKYRPKRIKEFLVFMQDNTGGTGIKRVDLAIRMKRDDGSCRWWNGTRFRAGVCGLPSPNGNKRWADTGRGTETRVSYFGELALFTLGKTLKSSGPRSDIKNYTAFSRGVDIAGNMQDNFDRGQNKNTFDVRGG